MRPSRHMLTGEIMVALFALGYALSALIGNSPLHGLLLAREGALGVATWAALIGFPATALTFISAQELMNPSAGCRAVLRSRLVLVLGLGWAYALHLMLVAQKPISILFMHALVGNAACVVFYLENRRVRRECRQSRLGESHGAS